MYEKCMRLDVLVVYFFVKYELNKQELLDDFNLDSSVKIVTFTKREF